MSHGLYRVASVARPHWRAVAQKLDYTYHRNADGSDAWREDVRYEFDTASVALLQTTTQTLHQLCLTVVHEAIETPGGLDAFHVPPAMQAFIRESWRRQEPFLLGRFDLAWDNGTPKLIEYNADTPATLPESTAMQTLWQRHTVPHRQHWPFNSAALIARLRALAVQGRVNPTLHIVPYPDTIEDATHARYYMRWAAQAGLEPIVCELRDLEVSTTGRLLHKGRIIRSMLRMYPWELMLREPGARHLPGCGCVFLNPPWVSLLSNKALLPALWQRYPGHPNLLPAAFSLEAIKPHCHAGYVEKPIHARGGENVRVVRHGQPDCTQDGTYGAYPKVYQAYISHAVAGAYASVGTWVVGEQFAGITLRESPDPIIVHTSAIVPHCVRGV